MACFGLQRTLPRLCIFWQKRDTQKERRQQQSQGYLQSLKGSLCQPCCKCIPSCSLPLWWLLPLFSSWQKADFWAVLFVHPSKFFPSSFWVENPKSFLISKNITLVCLMNSEHICSNLLNKTHTESPDQIESGKIFGVSPSRVVQQNLSEQAGTDSSLCLSSLHALTGSCGESMLPELLVLFPTKRTALHSVCAHVCAQRACAGMVTNSSLPK